MGRDLRLILVALVASLCLVTSPFRGWADDSPKAAADDKKPDDKKVEDKKPEDKKPEDKKPEDKKPEDKKPEDKKPEDKKPEDKKPEDKKPEDKKPEDKKPEDKKPDAPKIPKPPALESKRPATKPVPENVKDLQELETTLRKVLETTQPATVGVRVGGASGSGVIINKEGFVLTAGHVVGTPGRSVEFIFADGKKVKGKTLGVNHDIDSGLMQITDKNDKGWPFVEIGISKNLKAGDWVIAAGHPGGYRNDRPPVVRFGRVLQNRTGVVQTDCTLVGGDSGGPLFDLDGRVVGINSRISGALTMNYHVPVDTFEDTWDRLVSAEEWGANVRAGGPWLGIQGEKHEKGCKVSGFSPDSPASKAELKVDDIILKFNGEAIKDLDQLSTLLSRKKAGDEVKLEILRGEETIEKKLTLGKRP